MQLSEARVGHRCDGTLALTGGTGSGGLSGAWAQKAFSRPILFPHEEEPVGSGFRARGPPAKQQGPGSLGSPAPVRSMESGGPGAKTACVAFSIRGALMYMNNVIANKKPIITNSNKLRTYSTARYYDDKEILKIIVKGEI